MFASTPAFQGDCSAVPVTISLTLPRELVERILLSLDIKILLTCRLVNREFNEIIQSSTLLQYFLACEAAGVIDNPRSPLSYAERLEALKKREDAWKRLKPVFETTIEHDHQIYGMNSGLTGGVCFIVDSNMKDLHYSPLPSSPQDNPRFIKRSAHPGEGWPGTFLNFALSKCEHDLIINVTSSDIGKQADTQRYSIDLMLFKFSTGDYHPLARHPQIHVQRSPSARPFVIARIAGDNLALVVNDEGGASPGKLFIFDWKTGHKRLQHDATENAYRDLVFVSAELLLVPNLTLSHFEVWHIPPSHATNPNPPVQVLSLKIPAVSPDYSLFDVICSEMPEPSLDSIPYFPPRPFIPSPENSIIIAKLLLESFDETRSASYALIMHRRALLNTIQKYLSPLPLERQVYLSDWFTNEISVHKIVDPDDGSVGLDAQSKFMHDHRSSPRARGSPTFATSPIFPTSTSPTPHITTESGSSAVSSTTSSVSRYSFFQIQWADWGPPISRWFQESETQALLNATSAGQRYLIAVPNPRDGRKLMVSVADFNPYNFRRNAERITARLPEGEGENNDANGNNAEERKGGEEEGLEMLSHKGVFLEEVYMGLKCVVYRVQGEYDFHELLMDDERLVGLKLDYERDESVSVTVLYIG